MELARPGRMNTKPTTDAGLRALYARLEPGVEAAVCRRWANKGRDMDDLLQEGRLGAWTCLNRDWHGAAATTVALNGAF